MSRYPAVPGRRSVLTENGKNAAVAWARTYGRNLTGMGVAAGVSYQTIRNHLADDEEFAFRVEEACAQFAARVMDSAIKRGVDGYPGPNGETRYSDPIMLRFLQSIDRERFGNQVTVDQHTTVTARVDVSKLSEEARAALEAVLQKEVEGAPQVASPLGALDAPPVAAEDVPFDLYPLERDPAEGYEAEDYPPEPEE